MSHSIKKLFLISASSNSGKTVLANGLLNLASLEGKKSQFYKPLSVDDDFVMTADGLPVASYLSEYARNARTKLSSKNTGAYFDLKKKTLHFEKTQPFPSELLTRDNINCDALSQNIVAEIRNKISEDISYLQKNCDVLIAEGGGNCLLGGVQEFSNRWPAIQFDFPVVIVIEGRDGGGFLSLLGLKQAMPEDLKKQVRGFVVNGVLQRNAELDSVLQDLSRRTEWPCLGIIPWFNFDENKTYLEWQQELSDNLKEHAGDLLKFI